MSDSIISSFDSHVWTPDSKEEESQILPTQYYAWGKALEVKVCLGSQQVGKAGTETARVCSFPVRNENMSVNRFLYSLKRMYRCTVIVRLSFEAEGFFKRGVVVAYFDFLPHQCH